jgi:signal peptidase I
VHSHAGAHKASLGKKILVKVLNVIAKDRLRENEKIPLAFWVDILLNIVIIIALVLIIRTFIISPFQVFGPSMCETLNYIDGKCQKGYGEYIIINKIGYLNVFGWQVGQPQRGDIIVFHPPNNANEFFIKRIIGLPGETVKLVQGDIYVYNSKNPDGFKLAEPYLSSINQGNTHPYKEELVAFKIPENHYFVLGDNRIASSDSRSCFRETIADNRCGVDPLAPYLPKQNIEGRAWVILWPLPKISLLHKLSY